jgi:hypothetical protein
LTKAGAIKPVPAARLKKERRSILWGWSMAIA